MTFLTGCCYAAISLSCFFFVVGGGHQQPMALAGSAVRCAEVGGGKGRGLVAAWDLPAGSKVLSEDPYAFAPTVADGTHILRSHFTLRVPREQADGGAESLLRCSGCKFARYTSPQEQQLAWPVHVDECDRIARCIRYGHSPSSTVLLVARILARRRKEVAAAGCKASVGGKDCPFEIDFDQVLFLEDKYGCWPIEKMAIFTQACDSSFSHIYSCLHHLWISPLRNPCPTPL